MRYIPVHTNILVEFIQEEPTGIISAEEIDMVKGRVTEIGEGRRENGILTPMLVRPDSLVWFLKSSATEIPEKIGRNLFVLNQDDIILIEED